MIPHHRVSGHGDRPVLVLGGSLGTDLRMWDRQQPLAESLRLVAYDHRGHGDSPVPAGPYEIADLGRDVLALMDALDIERASYCGVSIGGMVGIWLGSHAPDRIESLILVCTSAYLPPASMWRERAEAVLAAGSTAVVADGVIERWLTPRFAAEHRELSSALQATLLGTDVAGYAACCGVIERMDLRADLSRIMAPTLVVSGSGDRATPVKHQRRIAEEVPGARHEVLSPAAHLAPLEQPAALNRLIFEHIQ